MGDLAETNKKSCERTRFSRETFFFSFLNLFYSVGFLFLRVFLFLIFNISVHISRMLKCTIRVVRPSVVNFSHFRLLWNRWTEFNETRHEARSQRPLPSLWGFFSGRSENNDRRPCLWLAETFSTSLKLLNGVHRNLAGNKISTSSTRSVCVCVFFFRTDRKTKMAALSADWLRHFRLLLWMEYDETWQEARYQCSIPSLCFSGRSENQDGRIASDWPILL